MKRVTLEEQKKIQLEMLIEIDDFCRKHNIKYMLAFGTLLGAVRHNGFIPWDDDVDISMPLNDMLRFKNEFKSSHLKYCDIETADDYCFPFSRISHNDTCNKMGFFTSYGISIDLYPMIEVSSSQDQINYLISQGEEIYKKRLKYIKWNSRLRRFFPLKHNLTGYKKYNEKYRKFTLENLPQNGGGRFHIIAGPLKLFEIHTFDFNPFEKMIELDFEGLKFMCPEKYHEFLTKRYGNYMELPPVDMRHPYHGERYFWK